eukprot:1399457-Rhodomonas_salina.1
MLDSEVRSVAQKKLTATMITQIIIMIVPKFANLHDHDGSAWLVPGPSRFLVTVTAVRVADSESESRMGRP